MKRENIIDWNLTDYEEAYQKQLTYVHERIHNIRKDILIFTEHKPVYTLGKRLGAEQHLVWDDEQRSDFGIDISKTNRGGDVTYHGPGQIVGYPIISLDTSKDLHLYLRNLEQVLINALGSLGLIASRRPGKTGIWLQNRKVAAIGVAVKRWVTYHGFALNVNNDLTPFQGIIPCGITQDEGTVTSSKQELQRELDLEEIKSIIANEFWKIF